MIRLLLVDDHPVVRAGCQRLLELAGDMAVVAQAGNVAEACALFARHQPDITITDLAMPGSGGLELIRRLRERVADARVLVFSMHDSAALVARALDAGAAGFVTKSSAPARLIDAVHAVWAGRRHLSPDLPQPLTTAVQFESLAPREFEIFRLLAGGESLADCARSLHLSPKTVSKHQALIKDKLGLHTSAAMAHLALRHGLISTRIWRVTGNISLSRFGLHRYRMDKLEWRLHVHPFLATFGTDACLHRRCCASFCHRRSAPR